MSRRVLVTGASRGIGRAIAYKLAADGFAVSVHCRTGRTEAEAVATGIAAQGGMARVLQFDVRERAACRETLEADVAAHGPYYGIVCSAGVTRDAAFPALTEEDWDIVIETGLDSFYNVVHPLTMPMVRARKGGRIVTIASVSGVMGNRGQVNYSAAKAGLIGATKALAVELATRSITVNCVAPGLIDTEMVPPEVLEEAMKIIPLRRMAVWDYFESLHTRLACPLPGFTAPAHYPRKKTRSMGPVSLYSVRASELALADAGLADDAGINDGRMGVAYGSSSGSVQPIRAFGTMLETGSMSDVTSNSYVQMMPHTTAVNVSLFWDLKGRIIPTSCACASGSQAIGYAYEAIQTGKQTLMLAGGAEELSGPAVAVFDTLYATSTRNDEPHLTPRPFDAARDGLVVGEGAATLVLEEYEHAMARGARIHAEIVGFGCNSDGAHMTQPTAETMALAMQLALRDAQLPPEAIGYVNAHGTSTDRGDIAESHATAQTFGARMPISSLKSYVGHTLGACGALEAWWTIEMMKRNWYAPTLNLQNVDPACAPLDYIVGAGREIEAEHVMSNNFAFGGINTSLIFRRVR